MRPELEILEGRDTPSGSSVRLLADPTQAGQRILVVDGTRRNDHIDFTRSGAKVVATINGDRRVVCNLKKLSRILAAGEAGNDKITIAPRLGVNTLFRGGDGNDVLRGGRGIDALYGDDGDDVAYGYEDGDWLDGGDGNDYLDGGDGNDYLYGDDGSNSYYGGQGQDSFYGANDSDSFATYLDYDSFDVSYGDYMDYNTGYTYHVGEVNPYTGTSSYRYYDDDGTWTGWYNATPDDSWYWTMPNWYQELHNEGYSRIGYVDPYSNSSSYQFYNNYGDPNGWWYQYWTDW